MIVALLLVACGGATTPAPTGTGATNTTTSAPALGDNSVKNIIVATQSGNYYAPLDSTPDLGGTAIYFVASGPNGPGIFRVPAAGGAATALFTGSPFTTPRGIAISPDGKRLYITDPGANGGQIFTLSVNGGSPSPLKGSAGTAPQNLDVISQNGQQLVYFTGKDPSSAQPAVLTLSTSGANAPTLIYKGSPLVTPDGIVVTSSGTIYVSDRSAVGSNLGQVFKIQGVSISVIVSKVQTGNPAGIALSADEALLLDLNTGQTGFVTKVVGQNHNDAAGLHASPGQKNIFSWCGKNGGASALTRDTEGNLMVESASGKGVVYSIEL